MENEGLVLQGDSALEQAVLSPVMNLAVAKQRLRQFQEFVREYLSEGEDYGIIPGTPKPTLFKPGADKLCELYGLSDSYEIISKVEDFDRGLFDYTIQCSLVSKRFGSLVSQGLGSCNSYEGKYRWRDSTRKCPNCGKEAIIKGKAEYGGGWLCFAKKGGCGAKWKDGAKEIESQEIGKVLNDDVATLKNTILKMAKKRSKIDATLSATRSSGIFTQDMEDLPRSEGEPEQKPTKTEEKAAIKHTEEANGLIVFHGRITGKGRNQSGVVVCNAESEAGDKVLLRMEKAISDLLTAGASISADCKRLNASGDMPMYQVMQLVKKPDEDLTGVLQESLEYLGSGKDIAR